MLHRLFLVVLTLSVGFIAFADARAQVEGGIDLDIEAALFPNTKQGCEMRSQFTFAMLKSYGNGESPASIASFKMMEPLVTKVFDSIRAKGAAQTNIDMIRDYKKCIAGAEPVKNAERELLLTSKHTACTQFADSVLGTLEGIAARYKLETIQERYGKAIDFTDTGYESFQFQGQDVPEPELKNPVPKFIGNIYNIAQSKSYDDAVSTGATMVLRCF